MPPQRDGEGEQEQVVERIPWSVAGPAFIKIWGRFDPKDPQPEHMELIGQNGSGKTFFIAQVCAEMVRRRGTHIVFIATKRADKTIRAMGWPVVDSARDALRQDQCVFWPATSRTGTARREYQASRIQELLDELWQEDANIIVIFDEFAYIESLSADLKATLQMYLREGRSHGITVVAGKQRPQGVQRDMHSESRITVAFRVKDTEDIERNAELLGDRKLFIPILKTLSPAKHEFVVRHDQGEVVIISWIDKPVDVAAVMRRARSIHR
jgi:nucleoside-triphosphatase THEP1